MSSSALYGKNIVLAVTGSIAAYKAVILCRLLIKAGAQVKILMTREAADFVGPITFSTLSGHEVISDISSASAWNNHVELGIWADYMVVAPCTANTLAKMAAGICDNMVTAVYLSCRASVAVAPAMDVDMWKHATTRQNLDTLSSHGVHIIPVTYGYLASGLQGEGRMAEPHDIVQWLNLQLSEANALQGKHALVTAGPTYESIDPVRYVGNWSSGLMGIKIAEAMAARGCNVHLILGPSALRPESSDIEVSAVTSAKEMYHRCKELWPQVDIGVMAAAVADYTPRELSKDKIKKSAETLNIEFVKTVDIAASLGESKKPHQRLIGFAMETNNAEANALSKLERKNFDFIVLNDLRDEGAGFKLQTNKVTIFEKEGKKREYPLQTKEKVAEDIVDLIVNKYCDAEN